jgi:hypothetical protein
MNTGKLFNNRQLIFLRKYMAILTGVVFPQYVVRPQNIEGAKSRDIDGLRS